MSRLKAVDPAAATGRAKEIFEGPLKGKHFNIFKGLANAPAALDAYLALSGALKNASLSPKEQEVVQLAVAQANACQYCLAAHTAIAKGAGLSDAQTLGARRGHVEGDPKLDALARFAAAIFEKRGSVSDNDLAAFRKAGYGDQAIAEVVASYALAIFTNTFNHLNQTAVDFPTPPAL
jgi:uncharacterized peroxidase-related enzyme